MDETQWWGRRDALCRCTTAALYGPVSEREDRQLIFFFDEDCSLLRMRRRRSTSSSDLGDESTSGITLPEIPTEAGLIKTWKRATKKASTPGSAKSECWFELPPRQLRCNVPSQLGKDNYLRMHTHLTEQPLPVLSILHEEELKNLSKRQVLMELQAAIEAFQNSSNSLQGEIINFLRKWRLNSSTDVVLRKTNHDTLVHAYLDFFSSVVKLKNSLLPESKQQSLYDTSDKDENKMHGTLCHILSEFENLRDQSSSIVIYLHETCELELPVFGILSRQKRLTSAVIHDNSQMKHIYIILGAVRDITKWEYGMVEKACGTLNIPLVGSHLGPVVEFTSKIICAIAFHSYVGLLNAAVLNLLQKAQKNPDQLMGIRQMLREEDSNGKLSKFKGKADAGISLIKENEHKVEQFLHVICFMPFTSQTLTCELSKRDFNMWNTVRVCVCTLWRSRMVSSSSKTGSLGSRNERSEDKSLITTKQESKVNNTAFKLNNSLSLVFQDGYVMTLKQGDLVKSLAEKHHAAPSEHQILKALCERRDKDTESTLQSKRKQNDLVTWPTIDWDEVWKGSAIDAELRDHAESSLFYDLSGTEDGICTDISMQQDLLYAVYKSPCACYRTHSANNNPEMSRRLFIAINLQCLGRRSDHLVNEWKQTKHFTLQKLFHEFGVHTVRPFNELSGANRLAKYERLVADIAGTTITMLQHFFYHSRLMISLLNFDSLQPIDISGGKQKTKRKNRSQEDSISGLLATRKR
jgi:hypothetical protein